MKDYTYKERELEYVQYLKNYPPKKVWWDFVEYVFEYDAFYFQLECISEIADTQNESDEAIIAHFTKHEEPFKPRVETKLVCENKKIEDIYIARTFLYFSTVKNFSKLEMFYRQFKQRAKVFLTMKKDPFGDAVSESAGSHAEITCHPRSEEAKGVDPRYSNLIDVGLLIQIDGKCLKTFLENNGFGFHIWNDKYFFEPKELKSITGQYEFIKV